MSAVGNTLTRRSLSPREWIMLATAGLCLALFFATIAWVFDGTDVVNPAAAQFDRSISRALAEWRVTGPTGRMTEVSALGSPIVVGVLAIAMSLVLFRARDWPGFVYLTTAMLSASLIARLLQHIWDRARPETLLPYLSVTKGSFPSAHMFGAAACYVTLAVLFARHAGGRGMEVTVHAVAAVLVALIGVSRVYLGAHHTTDVVAGMAGGWAYGLVVAVIFSRWYSKVPR